MNQPEEAFAARIQLDAVQQAEERQVEAPAQTGQILQRDPLAQVSCREGDASCAGAHASTLRRATDAQPGRAPTALLRLQRAYGNRFVRRVVDLSRKGDGETDVAPQVEEAIQSERGGGQALDATARAQLEPAMNADFSGVRVHADSQADNLNRALSARAFTTGQDIFFRQDAYSPGSSSGRELLAHELTHVMQQGGGAIQGKLTVGQPGDVYEQEADQVAASVTQQEQQPRVERQPEEEKDKESMQARFEAGDVHRQAEEDKDKEPMQARFEVDAVQRQTEEDKREEQPVQIKAIDDTGPQAAGDR